jgi:hypothetical protein
MIKQQDIVMDEIVEVTGKTKTLAKVVREELVESTTRLTEIEGKMDRTQAQLDSALKRMTEFLQRGSTWLWAACIILTIIVIILFIWLFLKT